MKKITIGLLILVAATTGVQAQDLKKVKILVLTKKFEDAKTELDKAAADPKVADKPETYLAKAEVYGSIAGDPALKAKYPGSDEAAFVALKKYLELEPAETKLKEDNYVGINSIYSSLFSDGVKSYNAKQWDSAFAKFKQVVEMGDIFTTRKWTTSAFDTTSYLYAGVTAQNSKNNDDAAKYYGAIADRKIGGADYESLYDFLTKYYLNKKDEANFNKYIALAKEVYPNNTIWNDLQYAYKTDNASVEEMMTGFDQADAGGKLTSANYMDYGDYFINNKKIKDLDADKRTPYTDKAIYAFSKAYTLDTTNGVAAYNAGVSAYTSYEDASDAARKIKGVTPAIKAERAKADKVADAAADKSIEWLEKAYHSLSAKTTRSNTEKNVLGKSADILYNLYAYKRDRSKVLNPKDYDKYDAKVKYYDSMHGKF